MPKFCTQCGSQLSDDALFCNACGTKVADAEEKTVENTPISQEVNESAQTETAKETEEATTENSTPDTTAADEETEVTAEPESAEVEKTPDTATENENNNSNVQEATPLDKGIAFAKDKMGDKYEAFKTSPNRDKYIGFAAIGIVLIVVICVVLSIIFGGGYKSAVKSYMKARTEGGFDNFVDATPEIILEAIIEQEYDGDEDKMEDDYNDSLKQLSSLITDVDYDILDSEKFDSDQLEGLEDSLQDEYEDYVDDKIKVSKAYEVKVKITAKIKGADDDDANSEKQYLIVAKVNGDWGVVDESSKSTIDDYE